MSRLVIQLLIALTYLTIIQADNLIYHKFENDLSTDLFKGTTSRQARIVRSSTLPNGGEGDNSMAHFNQLANHFFKLNETFLALKQQPMKMKDDVSIISVPDESILNETKNDSIQFQDETFISKLVKDPLMLKLILEALIIDDLHQRNQTLNVTQVMQEIQTHPEQIIQDANDLVEEIEALPSSLRADRSTQETLGEAEEELELSDDQLDFFGDGI